MYLFYDTETDGYVRKDLPHDNPNQCHLVQLGAILCDETGVERAVVDFIIKPKGWIIPPEAAKVHGITQDIATKFGVDVELAIQTFAHLIDNAERCLAFNMAFDKDVISLELLRMGEPRPVEWPTDVQLECVMELARDALQLPPTERMLRAGRRGYKNPNLSEAYVKLFDEPLAGAHSALVDARAAKRVWFRIRGDVGG